MRFLAGASIALLVVCGLSSKAWAAERPPCKFLPAELREVRATSLAMAQTADLEPECRKLQERVNQAIENLADASDALADEDDPDKTDSVVRGMQALQGIFLKGDFVKTHCARELFTKTDMLYQVAEVTGSALPVMMATFGGADDSAMWTSAAALVAFIRSLVHSFTALGPDMSKPEEWDSFILNICGYMRLKHQIDEIYNAGMLVPEVRAELEQLQLAMDTLAQNKPMEPDLSGHPNAARLLAFRHEVELDRKRLEETIRSVAGHVPDDLRKMFRPTETLDGSAGSITCFAVASLAAGYDPDPGLQRLRQVVAIGDIGPVPRGTIPALDEVGIVSAYLGNVGAELGKFHVDAGDEKAQQLFEQWVLGTDRLLSLTDAEITSRWSVVDVHMAPYREATATWQGQVEEQSKLKRTLDTKLAMLEGYLRTQDQFVGMSQIWHNLSRVQDHLFSKRSFPILGFIKTGSPAYRWLKYEVETADGEIDQFDDLYEDVFEELPGATLAAKTDSELAALARRWNADQMRRNCGRLTSALASWRQAHSYGNSAQDFCVELRDTIAGYDDVDGYCEGEVANVNARLLRRADKATGLERIATMACTGEIAPASGGKKAITRGVVRPGAD